MATSINIKGKITQIPGVYTRIKSGVKAQNALTSYGNACIIDTGLGAGFVGGAGISGVSRSGYGSVYEFSNLQDFRSMARGGVYWDLAEKLFNPAQGSLGVSKLFLIKDWSWVAMMIPMTIWFWLSLKWVDKNAGWES